MLEAKEGCFLLKNLGSLATKERTENYLKKIKEGYDEGVCTRDIVIELISCVKIHGKDFIFSDEAEEWLKEKKLMKKNGEISTIVRDVVHRFVSLENLSGRSAKFNREIDKIEF